MSKAHKANLLPRSCWACCTGCECLEICNPVTIPSDHFWYKLQKLPYVSINIAVQILHPFISNVSTFYKVCKHFLNHLSCDYHTVTLSSTLACTRLLICLYLLPVCLLVLYASFNPLFCLSFLCHCVSPRPSWAWRSPPSPLTHQDANRKPHISWMPLPLIW